MNKYVYIWMNEQSEPVKRKDVKNTYTKGPLFCVMLNDGRVYKFPVQNIFLIEEGYVS